MSVEINLSYNTLCCLSDCVKKSIECVASGESVLTLPCDSLEQELEILKEYDNMLNELIENDEW